MKAGNDAERADGVRRRAGPDARRLLDTWLSERTIRRTLSTALIGDVM
jgi:hypothetical protein